MKGWKLGQVDELTDEFRTWDVSKIAYRLFYGAMPLWEHEEMGGVFYYLISKIKTMIEEIKIDLRQLSKSHPGELFWDILPKEERVPFSEIEMESDIAHFEINHSRELAGLGPEFLYRALHMDRLSRRNGICLNTRPYSEGMFIGGEIELQWDDEFPFTEPADRYETQNFEHFWSTLPPLEQPTVGWQKAWILHHSKEDSFEDALNYNRETEKDWEWGYALWDEKRLKEWKAPLLVPMLGNDEVAAVSEST
ncbi:hypothetical protein N7504_009352 [Penicillium tannophilum]|nr:hypothetical protein N7504_009352 [Penicillium tannophilum]